jgi:hypothetical protein
MTNGAGVVTVQIGENTAGLERAWTVRVNLKPGEEVIDATVDGKPVEVKTIEARPSDDGTPYHGYWPFGGKDANPASKAGPVAQVSLDKSARARTLRLVATKPIVHCSWSEEGCLRSTCCKAVGDKCYAKNDSWAACMPDCKLGSLHAGWQPWSCNLLGGRPQVFPAKAAASGSERKDISLFCFTVQMLNVPWHQALLDSQESNNYGIYACNASKVYTCNASEFRETVVDIWREIQVAGQYEEHDWTVKADVSAVFLPTLLVQHLLQLKPEDKAALYIENSRTSGIAKSLMVFSVDAVKTYLKDENRDACEKHVGNRSEELFFVRCLDAIGVGHMLDYELVKVKVSDHLQSEAPCSQGEFVAFSPYTEADKWEECYRAAAGLPSEHASWPPWQLSVGGSGSPLRYLHVDMRPRKGPMLRTVLPQLEGGCLAVAVVVIAVVAWATCSLKEGRSVTQSDDRSESRMALVAPDESSSPAILVPQNSDTDL